MYYGPKDGTQVKIDDSKPKLMKIVDRLFLGNRAAANDFKLLKDKKITHLVSTMDNYDKVEDKDSTEKRKGQFKFLQLNYKLDDYKKYPKAPHNNLNDEMKVGGKYIMKTLKADKTNKVLVYCQHGNCCSASQVCYYIMTGPRKMGLNQAVE